MKLRMPSGRSSYGLFLYQSASILIVAFWLAYSIIQDVIVAKSSYLLKDAGPQQYLGSIIITLFGSGTPLLMALWVFKKLTASLKSSTTLISRYRAIRKEMEGNTGIVLFFLVTILAPIYFIYMFIENYQPMSVVPLVTPSCAFVGGLIGYLIVWNMTARERLNAVVLLMAGILITEYIDWNPRKPFMRDLYRISTGMAVKQVEQVMGRYTRKGIMESSDSPVPEIEGADQIMYRPSNKPGYSADLAFISTEGKRVMAVEYYHD